MKNKNLICGLVVVIIILAFIATAVAFLSKEGPGEYEFTTIRGETVNIYGKGIYKDMSSDYAVQGLAQDAITLGIGIPLLVISLVKTRRGSLVGKLLLTGTIGYFLVTYLFYLVMGMYNQLFLIYVLLAGFSFYCFLALLLSFQVDDFKASFNHTLPVKIIGGFLIVNSLLIGQMWLERIIGPMLDDSIPLGLQHYTTLIVQGLDLSILLPASFIIGLLLIKRRDMGFLFAPIYLVFLSILMVALIAKVIGIAMVNGNAGGIAPFIVIPLTTLVSITLSCITLRNIKKVVLPL